MDLGLDVRVGVYAERSPETLVGMLAVLMAGGAFLPLDPTHPAERLANTLEDARVPVLLARSALASTLPSGGAEIVPLETETAESGESLPKVEPEDLGLAGAELALKERRNVFSLLEQPFYEGLKTHPQYPEFARKVRQPAP